MAGSATPSTRSSATAARSCSLCTRSARTAAAPWSTTARATASHCTRPGMPEGARRPWLRVALAALCLALAACRGVLVHEVQSEYSHIRVFDSDGRRAIYLGGDEGPRVVETL